MKKNLLFTAITVVIALFTTSCEPKNTIIYPENLAGFWKSQPNSNSIWYGLDVINTQTATLYTYQATEEIDAANMTVTYDATTGKGQMLGDGMMLQIVASAETTISIKMLEGDVAFTKGQKPAKVYSMTGLWQSAAIDDMRLDFLIFPPKNNKISFAYIEVDEFFGDLMASSGFITLDEKTGDGELTASFHSGKFSVDTTTNPLALTYTENEGTEYEITRKLVKQPKKDIILKSMQGIWNTSVPGMGTATIAVDENSNCVIEYSVTVPKPKNGKTEGIVNYCPQIGMGAVEPANEIKNQDFIELFGEEACGIFNVKSATEVTINIMGIEVIFTKQ